MRRLLPLLLAGVLLGCGSPAAQGPPASGAPATPSPPATEASPTEQAAPADEAAPPTSPAPPTPPASVEIPALGLDEALIDLGIADDGSLEVPEDPDRVGWFTGGGRPGGPGPTVVAGHVDSVDGPAVFARLRELAVGDEVVVTSSDGTRTTYVVEETRDVPQSPFPTEQVFGATPTDTLRLITCAGPYDRAAGRYTENRIVTARPA